jgi:hypothetical protein
MNNVFSHNLQILVIAMVIVASIPTLLPRLIGPLVALEIIIFAIYFLHARALALAQLRRLQ